MSPTANRRRLSRQDWIDATLRELASVGVRGVSVERLAKDLGATKGSFYWHFKDRPAPHRGGPCRVGAPIDR